MGAVIRPRGGRAGRDRTLRLETTCWGLEGEERLPFNPGVGVGGRSC